MLEGWSRAVIPIAETEIEVSKAEQNTSKLEFEKTRELSEDRPVRSRKDIESTSESRSGKINYEGTICIWKGLYKNERQKSIPMTCIFGTNRIEHLFLSFNVSRLHWHIEVKVHNPKVSDSALIRSPVIPWTDFVRVRERNTGNSAAPTDMDLCDEKRVAPRLEEREERSKDDQFSESACP